MIIIWDPKKQTKLRNERDIDLEEIKALIEEEKFVEVLVNPKNSNQSLILLEYKSYVHVVVVKIEADKVIIKTCYPSRKFNNMLGK